MKHILLLLFVGIATQVPALNIRIIESTSANPGHTMDTQWQSVAISMGHTPTISPQTTLDNTTFFASSDALIISSGVITLTAPRIANIQAFAATGKPVYIQAEYLNTYTANGAFQSIVTALGGGFTWGGTTAGTLAPMTVLGTYATTPLAAPSLSYFWYGCLGNAGANVTSFLTFGGLNYGFVFCPPTTGIGMIVTTSDQDWVRNGTSPALMQNILHHMLNSVGCSPLPLESLSLSALHMGSDAVGLNWNILPDQPELEYHLERSENQGAAWKEVFSTTGTAGLTSYTDLPVSPGTVVLYRLRVTGPDGLEYMSRIAHIAMDEADGFITLYPSPVSAGDLIQVSFAEGAAEGTLLTLADATGKLVTSHPIPAGATSYALPTSDLPPGVYVCRIQAPGLFISQKLTLY